MGMGQNSVAAATAVVGYDLAQSQIWKSAGVDRALTGLACCGSAAAADTKIDVLIDTVKVGEIFNSATGFPKINENLFMFDNFVPAGSNISLIVTDAPGTNPISIIVLWDELE